MNEGYFFSLKPSLFPRQHVVTSMRGNCCRNVELEVMNDSMPCSICQLSSVSCIDIVLPERIIQTRRLRGRGYNLNFRMRQLLQRRIRLAMSDEAAAAAVQLLDGEVLQHGVQEKVVGRIQTRNPFRRAFDVKKRNCRVV